MTGRLTAPVVERLSEFVPAQDLRSMRVVTGRPWRWLPVLLRMSAVTVLNRVIFRAGKFDEQSPRGLALIAHESVHIGQVRELGALRFFVRYLWGQFQCGFRHDRHPMETPAIALQRRVRAALEADTGVSH
ncbi:MAG: DUF4157 domain-containing protein [Dehalococcoidia bacterium]|nr:DUF4157 domain-containing protein [Dehalococcoidia bacterium]